MCVCVCVCVCVGGWVGVIRLIVLIDCVLYIFTHTFRHTHIQDLMIYKREQWTGKDCFALKWWQAAQPQGKDKCSPLCLAHVLLLLILPQSSFINTVIILCRTVKLWVTLKWYCALSLWIPEQSFAHHFSLFSFFSAQCALPHFILYSPVWKRGKACQWNVCLLNFC